MADEKTWRKIRNDYINGGGSLREIAKKYGKSQRAVEARSKAEKWTELKEENCGKTAAKLRQKTAEKIADAESDIAARKARARANLWALNERQSAALLQVEKEDYIAGRQVTQNFATMFDREPEEKTELAESSQITMGAMLETIAPHFLPTMQKLWLDWQKPKQEISEVVEKGGRGSTKSSFCACAVIAALEKHKDIHAVVIRRYGNTLRDSVHAQVQWAAGALGVSEKYKFTTSPMEAVNKQTGQKILFFGLDDPNKLKSIKLPFGYIGAVWFEELDQYSGAEQIRNVEQSCLRGGSFALTLKSFNPPAASRNWANRYVLQGKPGQIVEHTDYRQVPAEWLGERFLMDAAHLKEVNPAAYNHEYLGEVTGSGKEVFTNLRIEPISAEQIEGFDRIYHGVDWGWYPDPWAFNSCYYHAGSKTLYIFDELTRRRTSNEDTFKLLQERGIMQSEGEKLTADSAEKKSCADYTRWGIKCLPAIKGPGSVETRMKWLQSLNAIVIDPQKCPDTVKEFSEYEYEADKNGEVLPGYPDYNNHHIDSVSYALESIWRKPGK